MHLNLPSRTAAWVLAAALVIVLAAGGVVYAVSRSSTGAVVSSAGAGRAAAAAGGPTLTVERTTVGRPIPAGFVGLATEYRGLEAYAGADPRALDTVFEQLIRNLAPGQSPVLRIGGDSTDRTWWPVPHVVRPGGIRYDLTNGWLKVAAALGQAVDARLILGINFELDSARLASAEAQAFMAGLGPRRIAALELGNEPELYASFPWYRLPDGNRVRGRPRTYDYRGFLQDFSNIAHSLPSSVTIAGPSMGAPLWIPLLGQFLAANPRIGLATLHRYPLKHCSTNPVTIADVLSSSSSTGLAQSVAGAVSAAHRRGTALRIDEMNAISCGGMAGVSGSFATALWSLDALFAMARVGVDGVNFQTAPNSVNNLFGIANVKGTWQADVHPTYYGMMMFAQAAPPGSRLLRLSGASGGDVRAWATRALDGTVRVVLINDATARSRVVKVRVGSTTAPGTLERLIAPGAQAQGGVTLGGQGFGSNTTTGLLAGTPAATSLTPVAGAYVVSLLAASAAMLTLPSGAG